MNHFIPCTLLACFIFTNLAYGNPSLSPSESREATHDLSRIIDELQQEWAHINYQVNDNSKKKEYIKRLANYASSITRNYPERAEPKIWEAIIISTQASIVGGLDALSLVKKAKLLLEKAESINPNILDGSIYTSLGSLYYKVPGWPISFGDANKARAYLEQARAINPDGIDPNYFFGDYLISQGQYQEALTVLHHALAANARAGRNIADEGRREEIRLAIKKAKEKILEQNTMNVQRP
jgi:tetratricopeptide (TPR) repeat protein